MPVNIPISFPSERDKLQRLAEDARGLTPTQRMLAVVDALAAADALSEAGGIRDAQLEYEQRCKEEWRQIMKEFIAKHLEPQPPVEP